MTKQERRRKILESEAQHYVEQAKKRVTISIWDKDPIKQYVRQYGWLRIIEDYIEKRRNEGVDRPIKYFTLPGSNATDIGMLYKAGVLTKTKEGFLTVVICDKTSAEKVKANLGDLLGYSNHSFHKAVNAPNGELCCFFPFDVLNLDLCGAVITGARSRINALRTIVGIRSIFRLQRGQGFLLLLTASADDEIPRNTLENILINNIEKEDKFRDSYESKYNVLTTDPFREDYRSLLQLVGPKLIARIARNYGYKVVENFVAKYDRTNHKMICHSFEFEFLGRRKTEKKYEPYFNEILFDEISEELPSQVQKKAIDEYTDFIPNLLQRKPEYIDEILANNPNLETKLIIKAKSLIGWWES